MTKYTLPEPDYPAGVEGMLGENCYTAPAMARAYADGLAAGAASRDDEIAALRADAARYRWLRDHVIFGYPSSEGSSNKDAYLVVTGYGCKKSKKLTDLAIDAAIAAEGK